jgi:hypothetical protein
MKLFRPALLLLLITVLAYGLFLPQLGFYWDDLPISWIRYQLGPEALTKYFSTNRPIWGMLYQLTTTVIPHEPLFWQIFALFWRWLGAVTVFAIAQKLWKDKPRLAFSAAALFVVYPGFNQHWASFLYSHFYIVLFFFLYSYYCMLRAFEEPNRFLRWTLLGVTFSALNLWMTEYFYVLELMRVGFVVTALRNELLTLRERILKSFKLWLPYLAVFILAVLSRLFIFNNQIYGFGLTKRLASAPQETVLHLVRTVRQSLDLVLREAWAQALRLPDAIALGSAINLYYLVFGGVALLALAGLFLLPKDRAFADVSRLEDVLSSVKKDETQAPAKPEPQRRRWFRNFIEQGHDSLWAIGLGIFALLLAGGPFYLIEFTPSLAWPASRFTLPFMLGVALTFAGIVNLIPWQSARAILLATLVGFAAGKQFLWSNEYKQDWQTQKELFWQLAWRAPGIAPDTALLMNEGALKFYADNSLSPVVNWIYAPDLQGEDIPYVLLYPTTRLRSDALPKLEPDLPIFTDYIAGTFNGKTSQVLAIYFMPPGCLRILDPEIDRVNHTIPEQTLMRFAARLTNLDLILPEPSSRLPGVYRPEPAHGWCYFFETAELARQFGQWDDVVALANTALDANLQPGDPAEYFVFIEGFAHADEWGRAVELSKKSFDESQGALAAPLCRLWERIQAGTKESGKRSDALSDVRLSFACTP